MSRYLILLPAPEVEWAELPESERFAARNEHVELRRTAE